MTWKNSEQLRQEITDEEFREQFANLFAIYVFFRRGLVDEGFHPSKIFEEALVLTSYGERWLECIHKQYPDASDEEKKFALFFEFFHQELFVDVLASDHEKFAGLLSREVSSGRLRFPWAYGRDLYDRFFTEFPTTTDKMSHEETKRLLEGTPEGVFQLRDLLVGPFGLVCSLAQRDLAPPVAVPLWHCSDPACHSLHPVYLSSGRSVTSEIADFLNDECKRAEGFESEWWGFFDHLDSSPDWFDDMNLGRLPWLIGNSFSEGELRKICETSLQWSSKEIRERLPQSNRVKQLFRAAASDIAMHLTKSECFQVILVQKDARIAEVVESLINDASIVIPRTETRTTGLAYGPSGAFSITTHCSRFGIRSVSSDQQHTMALSRLRRLIKELYSEEQGLAQLEWTLRHVDGASIYEKLDHYLFTQEPSKAVRQLVFASPETLRQALTTYRCKLPELPLSADDESKKAQELLWKIGFDVPLYPEHQELFWKRLQSLIDSSRTYSEYTESDRENIRSAAVNFFVSLEEVLDYSLSFSSWLLLSDHFGDTKFKCNFDKARHTMAEHLNGRQLGSNEPLQMDPNGKNTLYPLVQGFAVLAEFCKELIEGNNADLKCPENQLPGFHRKTELYLFPFTHKILILDLRKYDQQRILEHLIEITQTLEKCQICSIRNRLEHKRTDFPTQEEIEHAVLSVSQIVEKMERFGSCPLVYLHSKYVRDEYGRTTAYFKDYKGREIGLQFSTQYAISIKHNLNRPQILVPWLRVGESFEILSFQFSESSEYGHLWENYPKKKARYSPRNSLGL